MKLTKGAIIFYTNFMPDKFAACAKFFVIRIRPQYKDDARLPGLMAHELEHVKQAWKGALLGHQLYYTFNKKYRMKCEVAAYKEQMKHYYYDVAPIFAKFLATKYNLRITEFEAEQALRRA